MNPHTLHWIAQDIRNQRAQLTADEKWARNHARGDLQLELFRRVNFWRAVLRDAEKRLMAVQDGE